MDINEAIEKIWQNKKYESSSAIEVLSHLNEEVAESLKALTKGDKIKAAEELEDAFSCMLIALKMLDIDPDEAVNKQIYRMSSGKEKVMILYSDRVEIRVADEVKGGWTLWSTEDLADALKVAQEFNCKVIRAQEHQQVQNETDYIETNNA
jgi:NTP pyrophosphatase (non-canonical NTP hydrolase)